MKKTNDTIRILQVVNIMDRAGLETMIMNYYRNIDKTKIQFDFLTHRPEDGAYDEEIKKMGGRIYKAPRLMPNNFIKYFKYMKSFFKEHPEYKIVHSHIDAMSYLPLKAAKKNNVPIRIAHSHSSKLDKDYKYILKLIFKKNILKVATHNFACSNLAGKFLFKNKKYILLKNAICLDDFKYNAKIRDKIRNGMSISKEALVIGHVGRFCYIKNQLFLVDIFNEIHKEVPNSYLLLIGKGPDLEKIKQKITKYNLDKNVILLIDRNDVNELYQAMDIFVMPSLFEGLPVVGVEAQANGLPCLFSNKISEEILITNNSEQMKLNNDVIEWKNKILSINTNRNKNAIKEMQEAGYDIKSSVKKLEKKYIDLYKNDK